MTDHLPGLSDILALVEDLGIDIDGRLTATLLRCTSLEAAREMAGAAIADAQDAGDVDREGRRVEGERYP